MGLIPFAEPVPGEPGQDPVVRNPRFVARAPLEFVFTSAGADVPVRHGLGRAPEGWVLVGVSTSIRVYDGSAPSNEDVLVLRASGAGTAKVFVL